jgi:hypothetical protein
MCRQIRTLLGQAVMGSENCSSEGHDLTLPRKASSQEKVPVPQTDTGRREENSKARGRTLVKELGKMTP